MKKLISFFLVYLVVAGVVKSQIRPIKISGYVDTVFRQLRTDKKTISLDLVIGDNQTFNKKFNPDVVITPPTLIDVRENTTGEKYIKAYVNSDHINIVCSGIGFTNFGNYQTYKIVQSVNGLPDDRNATQLWYKDFTSNASFLEDEQLNDEKRRLYNCRFKYFIKDTAGKVITSLTIEFVFPKPEPALIAINDGLIRKIKNRPAEAYVFNPKEIARYKKELVIANIANAKANDTSGLPATLKLRSSIHSLLFQFKTLHGGVANYLEYKLNDEIWKTTAKNEYPFILLEDLKPGKYKLEARYPAQAAIFVYEFEIAAGLTQTTAFKVFSGSLITALLGVVLFFLYASRQKRKLTNEIEKRARLQNQITYLQSRLQPHFIFNALNSIQGLINKRNIEDANIYISKFGSLLHEVLDKSDKTMQPLAIECKQVEYYLQLEQLRFKFQYKIVVDENINATEINIPTMLLQPFVENAIKHGIVENREAGVIDILIKKNNNDLIIAIKDNGKGYDITLSHTGQGNAMVQERINALNEYVRDQRIELVIQSAANKGALVSLYFSNWL